MELNIVVEICKMDRVPVVDGESCMEIIRDGEESLGRAKDGQVKR